MNRRWFRALFRRRVLIIFMLIVQAVFLWYVVSSSSKASEIIHQILTIVSFLVVLYIFSRKDKGAFKTTWVFLILCFPVFGGLFYLLFNFQTSSRKTANAIKHTQEKAAPLYSLPDDGYQSAKDELNSRFSQVRYLQDYAGFPIYGNTTTKYYSPGESFFEVLLRELEQAEHYIFLEFFIIEEGLMWNSILDVLKKKAAAGVKVRILYDDIGCFLLLPKDYPKQLAEFGIECITFNPFRPLLTVQQNNRDHRKIVVIDGKTAYTGGINLADEYINAKEKYGHWKDSAIEIKGKAAWSFTLMFLQIWELSTKTNEEYMDYYPWKKNIPSMASILSIFQFPEGL